MTAVMCSAPFKNIGEKTAEVYDQKYEMPLKSLQERMTIWFLKNSNGICKFKSSLESKI